MSIIDETDIQFFQAVEDKQSSTCELVLVVLEQLYVSFDRLGKLGESGPLLDKLTAIAYASGRRNG
jgi:hypothetical protein